MTKIMPSKSVTHDCTKDLHPSLIALARLLGQIAASEALDNETSDSAALNSGVPDGRTKSPEQNGA